MSAQEAAMEVEVEVEEGVEEGEEKKEAALHLEWLELLSYQCQLSRVHNKEREESVQRPLVHVEYL